MYNITVDKCDKKAYKYNSKDYYLWSKYNFQFFLKYFFAGIKYIHIETKLIIFMTHTIYW